MSSLTLLRFSSPSASALGSAEEEEEAVDSEEEEEEDAVSALSCGVASVSGARRGGAGGRLPAVSAMACPVLP